MMKSKRWLLLLAATLTVYIVNVESLKASALIHGEKKFSKLFNQTTTTTSKTTQDSSSSTTEGPSSGDKLREVLDEVPDEELYVEVNGTKIALTGIPQIDYVWDPNLPRELNGFNLSTYPFIDSMPAEEDIGFDCGDKVNGFYASIKFGCQLYHHCLYGVRSNFICPNFTAFDQKTFICHFVSEVDCKNSYKYWNRNDELYKATTEKVTATSSTLVPLIDRNLYKRPAPGSNTNSSPNSRTKTASNSNKEAAEATPQRNNNNNNKDDDEYANDPPSAAGGGGYRAPNDRPLRRPRPPPHRRRRPQYEYYYYDDDYEDEVYERRRQRPRNRRPVYYDDDYDSRRPHNERDRDRDRRPMYEDDFDDYEYDRRPNRNRSRGGERRRVEEQRRRPAFNDDRRMNSESERKVTRRKNDETSAPVVGQEKRREILDESDEKLPKASASVYDRPRTPPRVARPVPLKDKQKYSYKTNDKPSDNSKKPQQSQEYDDDYDYESQVVSSSTTTTARPSTTRYTRKQQTLSITTRRPSTTKFTTKSTTTTPLPDEIYYYDDEYDESSAPLTSTTPSTTTTTAATTSKSKVDFLDLSKINKLKNLNDRITAYKKTALESGFEVTSKQTTTTTTTTTDIPITTSRKSLPAIIGKKFANQQTVFDVTSAAPEIDVRFRSTEIDSNDPRSFVKIYKRPFLPSRGGNPYKARGLSPVGPSSLTHDTTSAINTNHRTTLEDIYNEEYDVELNDALNPNLKPLTSSRGINLYTRGDGLSLQSRQNIQRADAPPKIPTKTTTTKTTTTTTESPPQYEYEEYEEYI